MIHYRKKKNSTWTVEKDNLSMQESGNRSAGYVYIFYLGFDDLYKIGKSGNWQKRIKSLRAGNTKMTCIAANRVSDMTGVERKMHNFLRKQKIERETYQLDPNWIKLALAKLNTLSPGSKTFLEMANAEVIRYKSIIGIE